MATLAPGFQRAISQATRPSLEAAWPDSHPSPNSGSNPRRHRLSPLKTGHDRIAAGERRPATSPRTRRHPGDLIARPAVFLFASPPISAWGDSVRVGLLRRGLPVDVPTRPARPSVYLPVDSCHVYRPRQR